MSRNVILVTLDSLRADHCGFGGYHRETTPTLDQMANDGFVFDSVMSPGPNTFESMPAIITGCFLPTDDSSDLPEFEARRQRISEHLTKRYTIQEYFSDRGYSTAAFTPNPFTSRQFGFDIGFDHFEDFIDASNSKIEPGFEKSFLYNALYSWINREREFKPWQTFYDQVISWINNVEEPYFLWILLMDTHNPFFIPSEYRKYSKKTWELSANWRQAWKGSTADKIFDLHNKLVALYDDAVRYADAFIGELNRDASDTDPVIMVHADHGEALNEHGVYGHLQPHYLYEENIHVPLIVSNISETDTVSQPISALHIPQILAQLARPSPDIDSTIDGITDPVVFSYTAKGGRYAVRLGCWKLIREQSGSRTLFNLQNDPTETNDISEEFNTVTDALTTAGRHRFSEGERERTRIKNTIATESL